MPESSPLILIYGLDETLLQTRRWILEQAGYPSRTVTSWSHFAHLPDPSSIHLLILCHSLDQESSCKAVELAKARWPGVQFLALSSHLLRVQPHQAAEAGLALGGPAALLSQVQALVGRSAKALRQSS